ncbi:MAG: 2-oxoacid:acceptor oxidoreductase subunit alpha [Candidatus Hodarchaeales archaeon]|jgi:2-oxoglutarate ferredoxin oxidoreductase subunit alpha
MSLKKNRKYDRFAICWGGEAGDGLQSAGLMLSKFFNRLGYYVHSVPGTQSTIRGGHLWQQIEISSKELKSHNRKLNMLIAFTAQTLHVHLRDLEKDGILIYNSDKAVIEQYNEELEEKSISIIPLRLTTLGKEIDSKTPVLINTITIGAILSFLNLSKEEFVNVIQKQFKNKSKTIIDINIKALEIGYEKGNNYLSFKKNLETPPKNTKENIVISGNEAISLGAVAGGLKFLAQYPITPASSILSFLAKHSNDYGLIVRQTEDELAALSMVLGASFTGVRAMTATSGPGFSLMAEQLGYASATETPCVIVLSMRGGPSTGVPTKMEQADLFPAIWSSHGESPRIFLAPRSIEECFETTVRAFNLADKYQMPVILASDFYLSEHVESTKPFDLNVEINRGKIWDEEKDKEETYKRYKLTEDGISPRAFPPNRDTIHVLVGADHNEESHSLSGNKCGLPESGEMRIKMMEKRFKKFEKLRNQDMRGPSWYGSVKASKTLICWGSITGAIQETVDILNIKEGENWNALSFVDLHPLPVNKVTEELKKVDYGIIVEVNYTGQLETLLYIETNWKPHGKSIHPLTGEALTSKYLLEYLIENQEIMKSILIEAI